MLEKLALLKIALCKAPVFSRASEFRTSMVTANPARPLETSAHREGAPGARQGPWAARSEPNETVARFTALAAKGPERGALWPAEGSKLPGGRGPSVMCRTHRDRVGASL